MLTYWIVSDKVDRLLDGLIKIILRKRFFFFTTGAINKPYFRGAFGSLVFKGLLEMNQFGETPQILALINNAASCVCVRVSQKDICIVSQKDICRIL